jgi:hypothetical protein
MSIKLKHDQKDEVKRIREQSVAFLNNTKVLPPFSIRIPISSWDFSTIRQYNSLRKELLNINYKYLPKNSYNLPFNVWFLVRYVFEVSFVIMHILLFAIFIVKVPVFKGWLGFYVGFFFFSYLILGYRVISFSDKIIRRILLIKDSLDKTLKKR